MRQSQLLGLAIAFSALLVSISLISFHYLSLSKPDDASALWSPLVNQFDAFAKRLDAAGKQLSEAKPVLDSLYRSNSELVKKVSALAEERFSLKEQLQQVLTALREAQHPVTEAPASTTTHPVSTTQELRRPDSADRTQPMGRSIPLKIAESRAPTGILPELMAEDPEGVYLWEVDQLLSTVPTGSVLLAGCWHSRLLQLLGRRFSRIAVSDAKAFGCKTVQSREVQLTEVGPLLGGSIDKQFDFVVLRLDNPNATSTDEFVALLQVVRSALLDSGTAIVVTPTARQTDTTLLTEANLTALLQSASLFVTNHFAFKYNTPRHAGKLWMEDPWGQDPSRHHFWEILHDPVLQAFFLSRKPFFSEDRAPALGVLPIQPSSSDVRDVIFSLLRGGSFMADYSDFLESRKCLRAAMRKASPTGAQLFDEVAFHEGNIPESIQQEMMERVEGLRFADVRIYGGFGGLGSSADLWRPWERLRKPGEYSTGYRHMCRFMSTIWVRALWKYEYAMRIDDDVCVKDFASGNPFEQLRGVHAVYGYGLVTEEKHRETVHTMQPWLDLYASSRRLEPRSPINAQSMYFTNFFVSQPSWWLGQAVRHFLSSVDRTGSIYEHRWGDAPIQSAALHFFADPEAVVLVNVDYSHLSTHNEIKNGMEVEFVEQKKTPAPNISPKEARFNEMMAGTFDHTFVNLFAPCLVANHFKLRGAPFEDEPPATKAIKTELVAHFGLAWDEAEYLPWQAAQALQFDRHHADEPLPPDRVVGLERMSVYVRLALKRARLDPLSKEYTKDEMVGLLLNPCCQTPAVKEVITGWAATHASQIIHVEAPAAKVPASSDESTRILRSVADGFGGLGLPGLGLFAGLNNFPFADGQHRGHGGAVAPGGFGNVVYGTPPAMRR